MARKTDGEKIDELEKLGATLTSRVDALVKEVDAVYATHAETAKGLAELNRDYGKELALLKIEIKEFKTWKEDQKREREEWNRRKWAFGPNLVAAIISAVVSFVIAYAIPRH